MAWDKNHKQQTREKILHSAARLFTTKGFDAVGISDVMEAAGLTRGAFYAHFSSKSQLYAEAIASAAILAQEGITNSIAESAPCNSDLMKEVVSRYLSREHRNGEVNACPLAFLATDIHQRDNNVRSVYTRGFEGFLRKIEEAQGGNSDAAASLQSAVLMIGGLAVARALNDDTLSEQLLQACRDGVDKVLT